METDANLRRRVVELETAIRKHRDRHADDRCWLNDLDLYAVLGDDVQPDNQVGDKSAMLENCRRFIEVRCSGGAWKSYAELEAEIQSLREELAELARARRGD